MVDFEFLEGGGRGEIRGLGLAPRGSWLAPHFRTQDLPQLGSRFDLYLATQ